MMFCKNTGNVFEVMLKDALILKINTEDGSVCSYLDYAPFDLQLIDNPKTIADRVQNVAIFKEWCAGRTLMMSQRHAKAVCNALNLSQDMSLDNKANIALSYHCCTLNDGYWVKSEGSSLTYKDVSLFFNYSRNLLTPVSLKGDRSVGTLFNQKLKNWSDIGTDGTLAKSWIRNKDGFFLYKDSDNLEGELVASDVLSSIEANSVKYWKDKYDGVDISVCKCFTNEDVSFVPYRTFFKYHKEQAILYIQEHFLSDYADLAVATYLTGNTDLHDKNWGLLYDNNTHQITGLSPLFDFDGCFFHYGKSHSDFFLPECLYKKESGEICRSASWDSDENYEMIGPTTEEAATKYAPFCTFQLDKINYDHIPTKFADELKRRVDVVEKSREMEINQER